MTIIWGWLAINVFFLAWRSIVASGRPDDYVGTAAESDKEFSAMTFALVTMTMPAMMVGCGFFIWILFF